MIKNKEYGGNGMKCPNCGATVLQGDTVCKKCGANLVEVHEHYEASEQYRSRFMLLGQVFVNEISVGAHLRWLGYYEKADAVKEMFQVHYSQIFIHPITVLIKSFILAGYCLCEMILVAFGRYRNDAAGHPIRYFKPKCTKGKIKQEFSQSQPVTYTFEKEKMDNKVAQKDTSKQEVNGIKVQD